MRCDVLLFAQLRQELGRDRLTIELPNGATAADAIAHLAQQYEAIAKLHGQLAVAVNERYERHSAQLEEGCTIALIPPVSGG